MRFAVFFAVAVLAGLASVVDAPTVQRPLALADVNGPAPVGASWTELAAPTPLDAAEERGAAAAALARRFNPAMAFPIREVWPVEVRYAWHDGADLVAQREGDDDDRVVVPSAALAHSDWSRLPPSDADGRAVRYYIDSPGDDGVDAPGGPSRWRARFAAIAQPHGDATVPRESPYPPTQYAHIYWWNRARGVLAVQYWFYYPFNEWVNHHEGDWEHIQILLTGPKTLADASAFTPAVHQFFFHSFEAESRDVARFGDADEAGDHALVYVGGVGDLFGYGGPFSGGSYPLPALFPRAAFNLPVFNPGDDTRKPVRFLAAQDFRVILLPEPERLDARAAPELSWLRLPFHVGQRTMERNLPLLGRFGGDRPPLQPAARREWRGPANLPIWNEQPEQVEAVAQSWPGAWPCARLKGRSVCDEGRTSALAARVR